MTDRKSAQELRQIRENVHNDWCDAAEGWSRQEPQMTSFMWPIAQRITARAQLTTKARVLDVGCGIGNPGLQIATVVTKGSVLCLDMSEGMLETCRRRAHAYGLGNVSFRRLALEDLDEPPSSFDAVVSQFGVNLFADVATGLRKMHTLLKCGGRICVAVWTPPARNPAFAIPSRELRKVVTIAAPDPEAPGAFRLAGEGEIAAALAEAGFENIRVEEVPTYQFGRTPDDYWKMLLDVSIFFRRHFDKLNEAERCRVEEGFKHAVAQHRDGEGIRVPALAQVGSADKV